MQALSNVLQVLYIKLTISKQSLYGIQEKMERREAGGRSEGGERKVRGR